MSDLYIPVECIPIVDAPIYDGLFNIYVIPKSHVNIYIRCSANWLPNTDIKDNNKDHIILKSKYTFPSFEKFCKILNNVEYVSYSTENICRIEWTQPIYIKNEHTLYPAIITFFTQSKDYNKTLALLSLEIYDTNLNHLATYCNHWIQHGIFLELIVTLKNLLYNQDFYLKPKFNIELDNDAPIRCSIKYYKL